MMRLRTSNLRRKRNRTSLPPYVVFIQRLYGKTLGEGRKVVPFALHVEGTEKRKRALTVVLREGVIVDVFDFR